MRIQVGGALENTRVVLFFMIINLSSKEKWLPFDDQRGAVQMIKNTIIHTRDNKRV